MLKRILQIVAIVLVLILLGVTALVLTFDPNDYKDQIQAQVEKQTGRQLSIKGDIELSIFPWLGMKLGHVELANAKGFSDKPMAEISSAQVHLRLLPLLSKNVEVSEVELKGLRLRLAKSAQGISNWDDIIEHMAGQQDDEKQVNVDKQKSSQNNNQNASADKAAQSADSFINSLEIGKVAITDAAISWKDQQAKQAYALKDFNLTTSKLVSGEPFDLSLQAHVEDQNNDISAEIDLNSQLLADLAKNYYEFSKLSLNIDAKGQGIPNNEQSVKLTANGHYDMAKARFTVQDLAIKAAGLDIDGQAKGEHLDQTPQFSGKLNVAEFNPKKVLPKLGVELAPSADDKALTALSLAAQFSATPERADLKSLKIVLDSTHFNGQGKIRNFEHPKINFDLDVDAIDVDRYMPQQQVQKEQPQQQAAQAKQDQAKKAKAGDSQELDLDLTFLNNFDAKGSLQIGELKVANLTFEQAQLKANVNNGVLNIKPLSSHFYDGKIKLTAKVNGQQKTPRLAVDTTVSGVQIEPLLKDAADLEFLAGQANINLAVHARGRSIYELKRGLNGHGQMVINNGAFTRFDLDHLIDTARKKAEQGGKLEITNGKKTAFDQLKLALEIDDGVAQSNDLKIRQNNWRVIGHGRYDIADDDLDYTANITIDEDTEKSGLSKLAGLTIPLRVSGPIANPDYSIDIVEALKTKAEHKVQHEIDKAKQRAKEKSDEKIEKEKDKLEKKLKNKLKGLF